MTIGTKAIGTATRAISGAMQRVKTQFGTRSVAPEPKLLTPKQQLDLFASMEEQDFEALRQQQGDEAFKQYVEAMTRMAREV